MFVLRVRMRYVQSMGGDVGIGIGGCLEEEEVTEGLVAFEG